MTTRHTGGHAFPTQTWDYDGGGQVLQYQEPGMSLRDYFAAKVCAALLTATSADHDFPYLDYQQQEGGPTVAERVATIAYRMADAMLKARDEI